MLGNFKSVPWMWSPSSLLTWLDLESPTILRNTCSVPVGFSRNDQLKRRKGCIISYSEKMKEQRSKVNQTVIFIFVQLPTLFLHNFQPSINGHGTNHPCIPADPAIHSCPWHLRQHLLYNKAEEWAMSWNLRKYFEDLYLEYSISFLSGS